MGLFLGGVASTVCFLLCAITACGMLRSMMSEQIEQDTKSMRDRVDHHGTELHCLSMRMRRVEDKLELKQPGA